MAHDEVQLHAAWRRWHLPGEPSGVIARYREPHRHYHGVRHLARVVADAVWLLDEGDAGAGAAAVDDPATVVAGAFFHDAVYDPRSSTNEADSARLAGVCLSGWDAPRRAEVARLVLATAGHDLTDAADTAAAVLLDADLAILGADPAAYAAYARGVRAEYAHVTDDEWRAGRARVLEAFLGRDVIYRTAAMRPRTARARANLSAELASLR